MRTDSARRVRFPPSLKPRRTSQPDLVAPFLLAVVVALLCITSPSAQQPQPGAPPQAPGQPPAVFRSSVRLQVLHVTAKDKQGQPLKGLTAADFAVTEDNKPQEIAFVEYQQIAGETGSAPPENPAEILPDAAPSQAPEPVINASIATPPPGTVKYQDRRLLVFYFDQSSMPLTDQQRAFESARKFLDTQLAAADMVAVMTFQNGTVKVRQDFTANRAALREVIQTLQVGDDLDGDGLSDAADSGDAEFNIFNTDRQLSALQSAVTSLRALAERKTLIYFGSGLRLNGADNMAQQRATINAANRANVTINPIDARGLTASAPLGNANRASAGGAAMFTGSAGGRSDSSNDSLYALAKDTGGQAMFDANDLSLGIVKAAQAATDYYIVGYYTANTATDGKLRRIRLTLTGGRQADLSYRQGYFADKTFAAFNNQEKERQLEEAFLLEDPITEITIALELNYFQLDRANYSVPVAIKIPGSELTLARRRGAARTTMDFITEVKASSGFLIQRIRDKIDIRLSDSDAEQLARGPLQYESGYTLLPGDYVIKVLARDATTGRIGTYQTNFTVPNLVRESTRLPTSSIVLSSQRQAVGDELFAVNQADQSAFVNPLVHEGQKLVPSVTRVFSRSRELFVYLEAYQRGETTQRPLVAFVTFFQDGEKAFETTPLPVVEGMNPKSKAVAMRFSVPLAEFTPGRYDCQVTVLDPATQKASFWRMPLVVVP
jgi:VWFA-related protein